MPYGFLLPRCLWRWLIAAARAAQGSETSAEGLWHWQWQGQPRTRKQMCDIQLSPSHEAADALEAASLIQPLFSMSDVSRRSLENLRTWSSFLKLTAIPNLSHDVHTLFWEQRFPATRHSESFSALRAGLQKCSLCSKHPHARHPTRFSQTMACSLPESKGRRLCRPPQLAAHT